LPSDIGRRLLERIDDWDADDAEARDILRVKLTNASIQGRRLMLSTTC